MKKKYCMTQIHSCCADMDYFEWGDLKNDDIDNGDMPHLNVISDWLHLLQYRSVLFLFALQVAYRYCSFSKKQRERERAREKNNFISFIFT